MVEFVAILIAVGVVIILINTGMKIIEEHGCGCAMILFFIFVVVLVVTVSAYLEGFRL